MCQINCLYLTILFLCYTIHLTQYNFFVQASGFLGDSCLPLETIRIYRMYQTVIQYIDIPAVVVLTKSSLSEADTRLSQNVFDSKTRLSKRPI